MATESEPSRSRSCADLRSCIAATVGFEYDPWRQDSHDRSRRPAAFTNDQLAAIATHLGVGDVLTGHWTKADALAAVSGAADFPMGGTYVTRGPGGVAVRLKKAGVAAVYAEVLAEDD